MPGPVSLMAPNPSRLTGRSPIENVPLVAAGRSSVCTSLFLAMGFIRFSCQSVLRESRRLPPARLRQRPRELEVCDGERHRQQCASRHMAIVVPAADAHELREIGGPVFALMNCEGGRTCM